MLKAVLFDLDGTLTHTDPIHLSVWQTMLVPYGLEFDEAFYKANFSGRLNVDILKDLLPQLSPAERAALSEAKETQFRVAAGEQLVPMPGLMALLGWLRQQSLAYAVVTNAPRPNAEFMLQALRLDKTFDTVVIGDDLPQGKPSPLPYQTALAKLNLPPAEALVFEDSPAGVRAAVAADICTVGITSTYEADLLYDLGVTLAVADFTDPRLREFGLQGEFGLQVP
ncbi:MAG: HAD family phosphatase [Cyanobacteria bacterium J06648_16]